MFRFCFGAMGALVVILIAIPSDKGPAIDQTVTASTGVATEGNWLVTSLSLKNQTRRLPLALPDNLGF